MEIRSERHRPERHEALHLLEGRAAQRAPVAPLHEREPDPAGEQARTRADAFRARAPHGLARHELQHLLFCWSVFGVPEPLEN